MGKFTYLNFNERLSRDLSVTDQEDPGLKPRVEIFPQEMRKFVQWSKGKLILQFNEAGIFQFNLMATSDYKVSSSESFLVEVFPEGRKEILLFADSTRDPEVVFYKKTFENMDIMNPSIQEVNQRNISGRDTLVITTSTLMDPSTDAEILKAIDSIKNIIIASPLISHLPQAFLTRLVEKYDFRPIGRYSDLPNMPPLTEMKMVGTSQFVVPEQLIHLKGTASLASANPAIFDTGLDDKGKICKGVLGLTITDYSPYVLGVVCPRPNGGRFSILGTEWADLNFTEEDTKIPAEWFNTMLKDQF